MSCSARKWYYAKVLRKRATFIALEILPYFYASPRTTASRTRTTCCSTRKAG